VATAAGARDFERARRAAWTGAVVAAGVGLVFSVVALFGGSWMSLFTADPAIREAGAIYLLCLAAVFPLTGVGLACYFACLAVGYASGPFLLAVARVVMVVAGGWLALHFGGGLIGLSLASAAAFALFGASVFLVTRSRFAELAKR
jgi:Na+-driven multidrug efflux pump